jgi:hypothetical protein
VNIALLLLLAALVALAIVVGGHLAVSSPSGQVSLGPTLDRDGHTPMLLTNAVVGTAGALFRDGSPDPIRSIQIDIPRSDFPAAMSAEVMEESIKRIAARYELQASAEFRDHSISVRLNRPRNGHPEHLERG